MSEFDEEGRKQRSNEKQGANVHVCLSCGFVGDAYQFERHHLAGECFDGKLIFRYCVRCHRDFSRQQWALPKPSLKSPPIQECVAHFCIGIAIVIEPIANTIEEYGQRLTAEARRRKRSNNSLQIEIGQYHGTLTQFLRMMTDALRNWGNKLLGKVPDGSATP